jgi:predicted Zn finger-like uncharacterized protein
MPLPADGTNQDSWKEITQLLVFARNPIDAGPAHPQGIEIAMRLTCPNCGARYEVDDALIPPEGRDVQCSDCVTTWFQAGRRTSMPDAPAARPPFVEEADAEDEVVHAPEAAEEEIEASDVHPPADAEEDAVPDLETVHETAETESTAEAPADEAVDQPGMADDADADTAEDIPPQTVHVHEPDEEVLAEIPESVESATQVVGENDTPEIDEAEDAEPAEEMAVVASSDMGGARREIDPACGTSCARRRNARPVCAGRGRSGRNAGGDAARRGARGRNTAPGGARNSRMPRTPSRSARQVRGMPMGRGATSCRISRRSTRPCAPRRTGAATRRMTRPRLNARRRRNGGAGAAGVLH